MEENAKKIKSVLKTIGNVIFFVFIAFMAVLIVLSVISKKTGKRFFSYSMLWVLTDSMEPTIGQQSYILVKNADVSELKQGDVITFISHDSAIEGQFNTHRIYEVVEEGKEFITKGDNCPTPDEQHVFADDIEYEYVCTLSVLTFFGRVVSSTLGHLAIVGAILVFIVIYLIFVIKRYKKEKEEKERKKEIDRLVSEEVKRLEEKNNG